MATFDFHFHPVFKQYLCEFDGQYPSVRDVESLREPMELTNPVADFLEENFLHILESQSCLTQLETGGLTLGMANIAPIERMFAQKEGLFGFVLNSAFFTSPVDQTYLRKVRNGEISYYQLFLRELVLYKKLRDAGVLTMLTRQNPVKATGSGPFFTLALEGGHSLCRTRIGRPGVRDAFEVPINAEDALVRDFRDNFVVDPAQSLQHLQQALWDEGLDLMSLVITHLSHIPEQHIATHAFGLKMLKDEAAYPIADGISPAGKRLIDKAYKLQVNVGGAPQDAPVLIDVKHMGLKSRLQFYAHRRANGFEGFPIIASHMGVTGYSVDEWKSALAEAKRTRLPSGTPVVSLETTRRTAGEWGVVNKRFTFNPWTINLMDDDIVEILNSEGLIGLSLDVRILGWQDFVTKGEKAEFMSAEEFRFFFPELFRKLSAEPLDAAESFLVPTKEERHPLALCFNLLHIISVGKLLTDANPWERVTIGSDFDGLINPLVNCRDASRFPGLGSLLLRWLPVAEKSYRAENGGPLLLDRNARGEVDEAKLRKNVDRLLFENGEAFLRNQRWIL